jgi:hypothetical protein
VNGCVSDLNRLLERLSDSGIEFVVVGGFAATLHGSTMVTRDIDVCAPLDSETVHKLRAALRDIKPTHRLTSQQLSFLESPPAGTEVRNLYLQTELGAVDILSSIKGVGDFARVREGAIEIELFGRRCLIMSLQDLIVAKEALGREKDLFVAKELRAVAAKQLHDR